MNEESSTPNLIELGRRLFGFANERNLEASLRFYAPDAIFEARDIGTFEGRAAIRRFWTDWIDSYETFEIVIEELLDLGDGVGFAALHQTARLVGSNSDVSLREAWVATWRDGMIVRVTTYSDLNAARAAAGRLAEQRSSATSEANMELVRSIFAGWERGDFSSVEWAHPEIEFVTDEDPPQPRWGVARMAESWRDVLSSWDQYRLEAEEYRALDNERVLVFLQAHGHGKTSGVELGQMQSQGAALFHVREGLITRLASYTSRARAFADVGRAE